MEEFKKNPGKIWIMKPVAKSQGKGIFLFRKLKDITDWKKGEYQPQPDPTKEAPETYVVQRYIDDPYLIGGRKFDLRCYLLVTSVSASRGSSLLLSLLNNIMCPVFQYIPLKLWVFREGFARLSNTRYSVDSIDDTCEQLVLMLNRMSSSLVIYLTFVCSHSSD